MYCCCSVLCLLASGFRACHFSYFFLRKDKWHEVTLFPNKPRYFWLLELFIHRCELILPNTFVGWERLKFERYISLETMNSLKELSIAGHKRKREEDNVKKTELNIEGRISNMEETINRLCLLVEKMSKEEEYEQSEDYI